MLTSARKAREHFAVSATNSPYRSYQRFCHMNEAKGSFCIEMTL